MSIGRIQLIEARCAFTAVAEPTILTARLAVLILWEAGDREVGKLTELTRQVTGVGDDPLALAPDAIGVEIELVQTLLGHGRDVRGVACGLFAVLVGVALAGREHLSGGVVRLLEDVGDLVTDALDRAADRGVWRLYLLGLELKRADLLLKLRHVGVDVIAVISAPRRLEQIPASGQLFTHSCEIYPQWGRNERLVPTTLREWLLSSCVTVTGAASASPDSSSQRGRCPPSAGECDDAVTSTGF